MMKKIIYSLSSTAMLVTPLISFAQFQSDGGEFGTLLESIIEFANDTLIPFIIGIGFLVFVWGMFKYFIAGGADATNQKEGKDLMIWATLGFVLIEVFWGVVNLLASSTGLDGDSLDQMPKALEI